MGRTRRPDRNDNRDDNVWGTTPKNPNASSHSKPPAVTPTQNDQTIRCTCGEDFTFTVRDQEFFAKQGFAPPKRCFECRAQKRARNEART